MRSFFHCSTARFARRASAVYVLVGSVCAEAAVIAFMVMFFGIFGAEGGGTSEYSVHFLTAAAVFVFAGLAVCFLTYYGTRKKTAMHSRYTYLDIQLKAAVVSIYDKEFGIGGEKDVYRVLYVIPFSSYESAAPTQNRRHIVVSGRIRVYGLKSDDLGYHVRGGDIEFDRWWLNNGSYEETDAVEFPSVYFGRPERVCAALDAAKKRFDEIPAPKKHVFREAEFIRRRPKKRVLPDDLDFSRQWK